MAWGFGEWDVAGKFVRGEERNLFTGIWLALWTMAGPYAFYYWLWNLFGYDVVTVQPSRLSIRQQLLVFHWTREFDPHHVTNLRFRPSVGGGKTLVASKIVFDYGAKSRTFADGVDEAEAGQIIELIRKRANLPDGPSHSDYTEKPSHTWLKL